MKPAYYLDAAKKRLNLPSDYALAKKMKIPKQYVQEIRKEKRGMPLSAAYWLAITLEIDPAQVVAELEAEREKNPVRKEFWRSFLSHARKTGVLLVCMLVFSFSAGLGSDQGVNGGFKRRERFA